MNGFEIGSGWLGIYAPMALGAIGSIIGCAIAGQAAIGAMLETEGGYGRFIGISAMPSSQVVYGIVVMFTLNGVFNATQAPGMAVIGFLVGVVLLFSAIYQGRCCASAINAAKAKPEIFGLSLAPAAMVEGFAVFAFIFALVLLAGLLNT
ncbi:MAG: ATP synthase subunit C [Magnetococcales bacterium]|nr:ATP synthase subunit C [Magnetococcales bacterium]